MKTKTPVALLLNDIHVSKDNIPEFQANWNEALEICKTHGITDMVIGGDLWQSRAGQTLNTLLAVRQAIIKATSSGIMLTIAEGNHDLVDQESLLGYGHIFSEYPNVEAVDVYTAIELSDTVVLYVMSYFPENGSFTEKLQHIEQTDFDTNCYNILYIHEGINGALATSSDKELPANLFEKWDSVLVGHYHDRCKIKHTNIEYIGSSRQHNFGEDEEKGYTIVYDDGSIEFIKNQANIRYKVLDLTPKQINANLLNRLDEIKDNGRYKIKARINCSTVEATNINKQQLLEAGATKVEIVTNETEAKSISAHALDTKYDKHGIKEEYTNYCVEKGINVEMGLQYLDKIN